MVPLLPMVPMPPYASNQRIGRSAPISGCLLARQGEATSTRARELHEARCHELSATSLRIEQRTQRFSHGAFALMGTVTGRLAMLAQPGLAHH
jgi:hypothetical protein